MIRKVVLPRPKKRRREAAPQPKRKIIQRLVENKLIRQVSYEEYRDKVRDVYGGKQGALLATASLLSLHITLGDRLLRERKFDLRGAKQILDVGSGAGQIAKHLLKYADPGANITCCDLSPEMLCRARTRLKSSVPQHVAADLARLPFADESFDCITCGYVLEHLPDARFGPRDGARRANAAADDRGQLLGGLDEPAVVLPDLQSPRAVPHLSRPGPGVAQGAVVHADAQALPRGGYLRRDPEGRRLGRLSANGYADPM
jgi:SAM-dependent methyltransferase